LQKRPLLRAEKSFKAPRSGLQGLQGRYVRTYTEFAITCILRLRLLRNSVMMSSTIRFRINQSILGFKFIAGNIGLLKSKERRKNTHLTSDTEKIQDHVRYNYCFKLFIVTYCVYFYY